MTLFNRFFARSAKLPTGLYILLALISSSLFSLLGKLAKRAIYFTFRNFFFFFIFLLGASYLSIYWTDFHDLFTK